MSVAAVTPSHTPEEEIRIVQEAMVFLRRTIEKMKSLQTTERVLAQVERVMLNRVPEPFDLKPLVNAIGALSSAVQKAEVANIRGASSCVSIALDAAFDTLFERDSSIMPYNLRRFCDQPENLIGPNSYAALTGFYRALPHTEAIRGKYDFAVTRLFASPAPGHSQNHRLLKIGREQVTRRLTEICVSWGETILEVEDETPRIAEIHSHFDEFISEIKQITRLEEVITSNYFKRIRSFKASVGEFLFVPEVTAASVEANIIINNRFLNLLELESQDADQFSDEVQLVIDVYTATYADSTEDISDVLAVEPVMEYRSEPEQKAAERMFQLLHIETPAASSSPARDGSFFAERESEPIFSPEPAYPTTVNDTAGTRQMVERAEEASIFPVQPAVVAEPPDAFMSRVENQELIGKVEVASSEVRRLELGHFLGSLPGAEMLADESELRRRALILIVAADEAVRLDLQSSGDLTPEREMYVDGLFIEMENIGNEMRDLVHETRRPDMESVCEVLLYVSNQLIGGRLRLQSALVRHNAREASSQNPADISDEQPDVSSEGSEVRVRNFGSRFRVNKWLMAGLLLLLVTASGLRLSVPSPDSGLKDAPDVIVLDVRQIPHSELIKEAKLRRELMVFVVSDQWNKVARDDQKVMLRSFLDFAKSRNADTVLLLDKKGMNVGIASKDEVTIE